MMLDVNDQRSFHWPDERGERTLRVRLREYGSEWSGKWRPDEIGETVLRLRNIHTRAVCFLRVEISVSGPTVFAVLRLEPEPFFLHPPFRLENLTLETLQIRQSGTCREGCESSAQFDSTDVLLPYRTAPYTWDEPTEEQLLIVELVPSTDDPRYCFDAPQQARGSVLSRGNLSKRSSSVPAPVLVGAYSLDRLGDLGLGRGTAMRDGRTSHIRVHMFTDGPTRVLQLTDARNAPVRGPASLGQLRSALAASEGGAPATSMSGASGPKLRSKLRAASEGNGNGHDARPAIAGVMESAATELATHGEDPSNTSHQVATLAPALIERSVGATNPLPHHAIALTRTHWRPHKVRGRQHEANGQVGGSCFGCWDRTRST